jgi:hypothetical protein
VELVYDPKELSGVTTIWPEVAGVLQFHHEHLGLILKCKDTSWLVMSAVRKH